MPLFLLRSFVHSFRHRAAFTPAWYGSIPFTDHPVVASRSSFVANAVDSSPTRYVGGQSILAIMGFGDFDSICEKAPIPACSLIGPISPFSGTRGILPNCYARNIEVANTIIFQAAASFLHIIALGMTVVMVLHVRSKFTAVGMCSSALDGLSPFFLCLITTDLLLTCLFVPMQAARRFRPFSTYTWH